MVLNDTGSAAASAEVAALETQYGAPLFSVEVGPQPTALDATRYADVSPWNAGDQIEYTNTFGGHDFCTSGFGLHDASTGTTYTLTDGHCSQNGVPTQQWWNTNHANPQFTNSDKFGSTISGTQQVSGADEELINPIGGSSCITWGKTSTDPNNVTRYYITGYDNPPMNASILEEGSISFEQSGKVTVYDTHTTYNTIFYGSITVDGVDEANITGSGGDSGGPVVYPSIYGPLAGGAILSGQGSNTWFQLIDVPIYVYSAHFGHTITVNTSPNGTSC